MTTKFSNHCQDRLIRLTEVLEIIPVSKSTWYKGVQAKVYPQPIKMGARISCWRLSDVIALTLRARNYSSHNDSETNWSPPTVGADPYAKTRRGNQQ